MASNKLGKISKERVLSGIVLVIIALASIFPGGIILATTLFVISIIGFLELTKACGVRVKEKISRLEIAGVIAIVGYYLDVYIMKSTIHFMLVAILLLIVLMVAYVFLFPKYNANQVMSTYFSFVYAPVMLSFVFLTRELENGVYFVWMIFISSWISDTCAYFAGVLAGKHKLVPVLSPKKTIEGSVGGIVGAAIVGAVFGLYMDNLFDTSQYMLMLAMVGGVGSVISQVGDLAASAVKRNHEIKDYGKLIPGHGGIMDRFDSVIFTAPIIYFLIIFLM